VAVYLEGLRARPGCRKNDRGPAAVITVGVQPEQTGYLLTMR